MLETKIKAGLENVENFTISINKVSINILSSELELDSIKINSTPGQKRQSGEIEYARFTGINIFEAIFKHNIYADEAIISGSSFYGNIPDQGKQKSTILSPLKINLGRILFDHFNLKMENDSTGQSYSVKEGMLRIYDFQVSKMDTVSPAIINFFDFEAADLNLIEAGRMYSYILKRINYQATVNTLTVDSLFIKPGFTGYNFTSRFKFQKNCIEAWFSKVIVNDFYIDNYLRPLTLETSYVEIGEMNIKVFRDRRKELLHIKKPAFQDMIYNIPWLARIDSINLHNGKITLTVHERDSKEPGIIFFNEISARLLNLTNDTLYKTRNKSMELKADARLMGKGKLVIQMRGKIFDKKNTFSVNGSLSDLDVSELNPFLEKNVFLFASGKIDAMDFSFVADNTRAKGHMTMLYHGLDFTLKDKRSDDTTSLKARLLSFIANRRILDSNPAGGEGIRNGIIDYERDPERFLFHYCFSSILTGISSTLSKKDKKSKHTQITNR